MKLGPYHNVIALLGSLYAPLALSRSVFLNGTDISSAKTQYLKKVDVKIDEKGDLHIVAPHYQVQEENTFVPLSAGRVRIPVHQNEPYEFLKEGNAPGVVPQFMQGTDKTAKTISDATAIKEKSPKESPTPANGHELTTDADSKKPEASSTKN